MKRLDIKRTSGDKVSIEMKEWELFLFEEALALYGKILRHTDENNQARWKHYNQFVDEISDFLRGEK